jgi:hypothetical protein
MLVAFVIVPTPAVSFQARDAAVPSGTSTLLTWTVTNALRRISSGSDGTSKQYNWGNGNVDYDRTTITVPL